MAAKAVPGKKARQSPWSFGQWRMRSKLVVILLLVSQIPLIAVSVFTIVTARRALLSQAGLNMHGVSTEVSRMIDHQLLTWREDMVSASQLPELIAYASTSSEAWAALAVDALKAVAAKRNYQSVAVVNGAGKIVLSSVASDVNSDVSFRPYFLDAMKGAPHISDPSVSVITNKPSIFASAPIRNAEGKPIAVLRSRLDLYGLWDLVEQAAEQSVSGTVAMLLDNQGIRIAHSSSRGNREGVVDTLLYRAVAPLSPEASKQIVAEKRFGKATAERVDMRPLPEVAGSLRPGAATTFEASADNSGLRHQSAAVPLKTKPWHLVLQAPQPSFTSAALKMTQISAGAAVLFGLLTILIAYFIARGVSQPVAQLTEVADRISLGELDAQIRIDRKDEIGDLAESLRRMQASLQAAIERLRLRRAT